MLFDGKHKSRANVSLRGDSKNEQRDELVHKTQQARLERELFRKRTKAATVIQAVFRSSRLRAKSKDLQRQLFEAELQQCREQNSFPRDLLFLLLRRYSFFFDPLRDEGRFVLLASSLLSLFSNPGLLFPLPASEIKSWTYFSQRVTLSCFSIISIKSSRAETRSYAVALIDQLALNPSPKLFDNPEAVSQVKGSILRYSRSRVPRQLQNYWLSNEPSDPKIAIVFLHFILNLTNEYMVALKAKEKQASGEDFFLFEILSIPLLLNRLGAQSLPIFLSKFPFELFLTLFQQRGAGWLEQNSRLKQPHLIQDLLGNLLPLAKPRLQKLSPTFLLLYINTLQKLIPLSPHYLYVSCQTVSSDQPEAMDEDVPGSSSSAALASALSKLPDPKLVYWLKILYSADHIQALLRLASPSAEEQRKEEPGKLVPLFHLFSSICFHFKEIQFEVLNLLAFGKHSSSFFRALWGFIKTHEVSKAYLGQGRDPLSDRGKYPDFWPIFCLFLLISSHTLTTLGDEEFHRGQIFLPIADVISLISLLKGMASKIFKGDREKQDASPFAAGLTPGDLMAMLVKTLKQLHDRDARRPFCPPGHWITKLDMNLKNLTIQFLDLFDTREPLDEDEETKRQDQARMETEEEQDAFIEYMSMPKLPSVSMNSQALRNAENIISILKNVPFLVPFEDRVSVFRQLVHREKQLQYRSPTEIPIRRNRIFEDGFEKINNLKKDLKSRLRVNFVDEFGIEEAGVDGGGLFKEFVNGLIKEGFNSSYGLFLSTPANQLYPNPKATSIHANAMAKYEFLGRMIGKCIYEGILVELPFAGFFLNKLLGRNNYIDDLPTLDPELYKNLLFVKQYQGNVEELSLYFCVTDSDRVIELIPGGKNRLVTSENVLTYIFLMAFYKLNTQIQAACSAFLHGLAELINTNWLKLFDQSELLTLISGAQMPIDLDNLRQRTSYHSPYSDSHHVIEWFWAAAKTFTEEEKGLLLQFVTSCSRPPLLGFSELQPPFTIHPVDDPERLPTASTCFNLLKLPAYKDPEQLRKKLLTSITAKAGFDLS